MFQNFLVVVSALLVVYIVYVFGGLIWNKYFKSDGFQSRQAQVVQTPAPPIPAPAPPVEKPVPEPPRVVSPSGPNPPNAAATNENVRIPEERPNDPFDETSAQVPMKDNLRNPERSFGPGVDNTGTQRSVSAGTASEAVKSSVSSFSPEFAQNGGDFMTGISANDLGTGSEYATI